MSVCRYCEKRHIGCHSTCEEYLEEIKSREAEREDRRIRVSLREYSRETHRRLTKKGKV
jgi:hypothetical protein